MEIINDIIDCIIRGTFCGICLGFCGYGLVLIWKWFFGALKRMLHNLFPKCRWFTPKPETKDQE